MMRGSARNGDPRVSVVIPTRGRPRQVVRAVNSVMEQTFKPLEVIVVVDGSDADTQSALEEFDATSLRVIVNESSMGAAGARNKGVAEARGELIAFLDDDDFWRPEKLSTQIEFLNGFTERDHVVIGSQAIWDSGRNQRVWPLRAPRKGERIANYLFVRNRAGEGALATPTILLERNLAIACPFPDHLKTHEEWDWFIDLERAGAMFCVAMRPLVEVDARINRQSISRSTDWKESLAWAMRRFDDLGPTAFSGFILTEVARAATRGENPIRSHVALGSIALIGRPRLIDLARFLLRPFTLLFRRDAK